LFPYPIWVKFKLNRIDVIREEKSPSLFSRTLKKDNIPLIWCMVGKMDKMSKLAIGINQAVNALRTGYCPFSKDWLRGYLSKMPPNFTLGSVKLCKSALCLSKEELLDYGLKPLWKLKKKAMKKLKEEKKKELERKELRESIKSEEELEERIAGEKAGE